MILVQNRLLSGEGVGPLYFKDIFEGARITLDVIRLASNKGVYYDINW